MPTDRPTYAHGIVVALYHANVVTCYRGNVVALYHGKVVVWWRGKAGAAHTPGARACAKAES